MYRKGCERKPYSVCDFGFQCLRKTTKSFSQESRSLAEILMEGMAPSHSAKIINVLLIIY